MPKHLHTEDIAIGRLGIFKKQREGVIRPISAIKSAIRRGQPISDAERRTLQDYMTDSTPEYPESGKDAIKDAVSMKRDDGATAVLEAPDAAEVADEPKVEVTPSDEDGKANTPDGKLHGAAAKAAIDPEEAALDLAPPGPDHEAFGAHDESLAGTQKAIVAMERANGPADKQEAVNGIFDAAKAHRDVGRQFEALAGHLQEHDLVGAPKARVLANAHHAAADALTKAATTGLGVHYRRAHAAVTATHEKAKNLSGVLVEQAKKRSDKSKAEAKKQSQAEKAAAVLDRRLAKRPA